MFLPNNTLFNKHSPNSCLSLLSPTPLTDVLSCLFSSISLSPAHLTILAQMICIMLKWAPAPRALRSLAKMAGELWICVIPPHGFLLAISYATLTIPLALPSVIVVSIGQCLCAQPTNSSAMDVFHSCCPAKASLRLAPQGFPADNTNTLRHFYYEKMDGEMLFVSPRHHLNISRVTLFSQVGLTAGSMATLVVLVCQEALRVIIFRQADKLASWKPHLIMGF